MINPWDISNREAMLQALVFLLTAGLSKDLTDKGLVNFKTVRRKGLERDCVAEGSLPAVLIDELSSTYKQEHFSEGERELGTVLVYDLQGMCKKDKKHPLGNIPTVRETLVASLFYVLENNRTLNCQLPAEIEPVDHARDINFQAEIRYVKTTFPKVRVLVTIRAYTSENFIRRDALHVTAISLKTRPSCNEEDPAIESIHTIGN